jgi:hypothetical protein
MKPTRSHHHSSMHHGPRHLATVSTLKDNHPHKYLPMYSSIIILSWEIDQPNTQHIVPPSLLYHVPNPFYIVYFICMYYT